MKTSILYNRKYASNSLHGAGYFPFWIYIKYFGKPVYKLARKAGINIFFSIMASCTLGSLLQVGFFIIYSRTLIFIFIALLLITTIAIYTVHKIYFIFRTKI
jgi:hypothetical protein